MKYDLKDIATVSGMPGLFKVLKPTRTGVILESLDAEKKRLMAQTRHKISILKEISVFTTGVENSTPLEDVFQAIYKKHKTDLTLNHKKASTSELKSFILGVVPDFDEDRVYISDIKKLVSWYNIISSELEPIKATTEDSKDKKEIKTTKKATTKKVVQKKTSAKPKKVAIPKKIVAKKNG